MTLAQLKSRLRPGPLLLTFYHTPVGRIRESLSQGGPWQQRRTERGRQEMESAAHSLPPIPARRGNPLAVHLLTGRKFWYQTAFCLHTLAAQAQRPLHPVIYNDGTLEGEPRANLARLFPLARFPAHAETLARLDHHLPVSRFPVLRDRWQHYPNLRKLTDPHVGVSGWKLVLDSDLLFFRRPDLLIAWLDQPDQPLHAVDCATSYGYSRSLLDSLAPAPLAELVNVGLCGLHGGELDWERIEHWCARLIEREGTHYYLEQALVAMLVAGRRCAIAPAADYVTRPRPPETHDCQAVMHHYVAESKRWYFQTTWRRALVTSARAMGSATSGAPR